jgi:hypothetical protein
MNNKLAIIIGQCELLSDQITDIVLAARVRVIKSTAQEMTENIKAHECRIAGCQ